ncbi:hypothetical protein [Agaribacterium sp. ZY112]|uniref:hypothetical protein n=1 Tax=Agaribacterium sp. ZY112 TaxID=3233574 RepID=UPI0035241A36
MIRVRETVECLGYCSIIIAVGLVSYLYWLSEYGAVYVYSHEAYAIFMLMVIPPGIINLVLTIIFIRPHAKVKNGVNLVVGAFSLILLVFFLFVAV